MKRFLSAVLLCASLLLIGLFAFRPATEAQGNLLVSLLSLPAPPPPNPFFETSQTDRDEKFYDKKNPPKDNAPIQDLLDYWKSQNQFDPKYNYTIKPSEKALGRILDEIEKNPESLIEYLTILPESPETTAFVKQLYDREQTGRQFEKSWRGTVKRWLTYHSNYFSNDLFQVARQSAETEEYVTNQDEVLALARVDWEKARPLLERMISDPTKPVSQTLARWAFYKHALAENNSGDIEKYRKELQEVVENKNFQPGNRDLAMDALVNGGDYPGRDDWYFTLLEDETLYELRVNGQVYTGLTTIVNFSPSDKYLEKMVELAGSDNPTVRAAAVRNLLTMLDDVKSPEVVRALLPWLENPKWARDSGGRMRIVEALSNFTLPESVPGLIAMLNEKETREVNVSPNSNTNVSVYPSNRVYSGNTMVSPTPGVADADFYPYRSAAIKALEKQKDVRAVSALRQILPFVENWERQNVVRALLVSNGFSIPEQIEGLETIAKNIRVVEETTESSNSSNLTVVSNSAVNTIDGPVSYTTVTNTGPYYSNTNPQPYNPEDTKAILGNQLVNSEEPSNELVAALIERVNYLETKNPQLAWGLRRIIQNWKGPAINSLMLRDLKNDKADLNAAIRLLSLRRNLREKQLDEIYDARAGGTPSALGIGACLLEDAGEYDAILSGDNPEVKTALLGCARLIRAPLPVQKVAENLKSPNKMLALAAERYLEAEDSPAARQIVLSLHPDEAKILGAKGSFSPEGVIVTNNNELRDLFVSVNGSMESLPPYFFYAFLNITTDEGERKLQKEARENQELLGIYAYDNNFIRIYKDRAVFSWTDDPARYRERALTAEEFENFKNYLIAERVEELPPFLSPCQECEGKQLLMLGRQGGRRIFVRADPLPPFFVRLEELFTELRKPPAEIRYGLEKSLPGLEILFADENLKARAVWKNGEDFRLLLEDTVRGKQLEKEREVMEEENAVTTEETEAETEEEEPTETERVNDREMERKKYENFAWYKLDKNKLGEPALQPSQIGFIPLADNFPVSPGSKPWKAQTANLEIRANDGGLFKISRGQMVKLQSGYYLEPLVTPNGRWAVVTKFREDDEEGYGSSLMRVNLLTNKEFKIKLGSFPAYEALAFLPGLNKVLIFSGYGGYDESESRSGDYFLLDVETGATQPVKGEIRPLTQQTFRSLQTAPASADEFWAAIPDRQKNETQVGTYNAKTLVFKPLLTIPQISFDSMNMWIDEKENKVYFVYEGQLLALPLNKGR